MPRFRSWMTAAAAFLAMVGGAASNAAAADTSSYPPVLICEVAGDQYFVYLDRIQADGGAVYISPERQALTVSPDGVVTRQGATVTGNCNGKTLDELAANGQTRYLLSAPE